MSSEVIVEAPEKTLPPGLEPHLHLHLPPDLRTPLSTMALAIHWSVTSVSHLRTASSPQSELLPVNWTSPQDNAIVLEYVNQETGRNLSIQIQAVGSGSTVAVVAQVAGENAPQKDEKTRGTVLETGQYVNLDKLSSENGSEVFKPSPLWRLREKVKDEILFDEKDARAVIHVTNSDPYSSKLSEAQKEKLKNEKLEKEVTKLREEREQARKRNESPTPDVGPSPLRIPPRPGIPRGIGVGDLDPFADPLVGGGMLMDPRGFRRPQLPQGIVPGARFDPIGPVGGFGPRGTFPPGGGAPRLPFGTPNPDHERPFGFDDMFS